MQRSAAGLLVTAILASLITIAAEEPRPRWSDCLSCHSSYSSSLPRLAQLRPQGAAIGGIDCARCHEMHDLTQYRDDWVHPGRPVGSHIDCTMCHPVVAHGPGNSPPIPRGDYDSEGCYNCHRSIEARQTFAGGHDANLLGCIECHPPHEELSVQVPSLLVDGKYRSEFSATYDWYGSNELCLDCHGTLQVIYAQQHGFVTYNTVNYHLVHVVNGRVLCVECHDPHGGFREHLLRDKTLTGELMIYIDEIDGGTCLVNCHGVDHNRWKYTNELL